MLFQSFEDGSVIGGVDVIILWPIHPVVRDVQTDAVVP